MASIRDAPQVSFTGKKRSYPALDFSLDLSLRVVVHVSYRYGVDNIAVLRAQPGSSHIVVDLSIGYRDDVVWTDRLKEPVRVGLDGLIVVA